jgi:predicted secreted protein
MRDASAPRASSRRAWRSKMLQMVEKEAILEERRRRVMLFSRFDGGKKESCKRKIKKQKEREPGQTNAKDEKKTFSLALLISLVGRHTEGLYGFD